jgi:hypothetical protein
LELSIFESVLRQGYRVENIRQHSDRLCEGLADSLIKGVILQLQALFLDLEQDRQRDNVALLALLEVLEHVIFLARGVDAWRKRAFT